MTLNTTIHIKKIFYNLIYQSKKFNIIIHIKKYFKKLSYSKKKKKRKRLIPFNFNIFYFIHLSIYFVTFFFLFCFIPNANRSQCSWPPFSQIKILETPLPTAWGSQPPKGALTTQEGGGVGGFVHPGIN